MKRKPLCRASVEHGFGIEWVRLNLNGGGDLAAERILNASPSRERLGDSSSRRCRASGVFLATIGLRMANQRFCVPRKEGSANPTELGLFAEVQWMDISNRFPGVVVDRYSLLPDRIKGLIALPSDWLDVDGDLQSAVTIDEVLEDTVRELQRLVLSSASRLLSFPLTV